MRAARAETWREAHPLGVWDLGVAIALVALAVATAVVPTVSQDPGYHAFADGRALAGIPNALDVLSNAGFVLVGALGLRWTSRRAAFPDPRARPAWLVLFGAVAATAAGSAYYHLDPTDARLAWDRLPMAVGFMALVAVLLGERFGVAVGRHLLVRLVLGASSGGGNLVPYLVVQYGAMASIPVLLVGRPAAAGRRAPWVLALSLYAAAKVLELADRPTFLLLGVSGHTLKHLVAAAAIGVLAWEVRRRGIEGARAPEPG